MMNTTHEESCFFSGSVPLDSYLLAVDEMQNWKFRKEHDKIILNYVR